MSARQTSSGRIRGWPWLLLAPALALAMGLLPAWFAPWMYDDYPRWVLLSLSVLLSLMCVIATQRRLAAPLQRLGRVLRQAMQDRPENRIQARAMGVPESAAIVLNELIEQLHQSRDASRGESARLLGHLRQELSNERAARERAQTDLTEARAAAQFKSDLLSNMSHELRTPLTAILGFSELLEKTPLNRQQAEYVSTLSKSAENLLSMINSLLDWNRIEAGRLSLQQISFVLSDCIEDVTGLLSPLAYDKGLQIALLIYHDVPLRVSGDPVRLQQIVTNLLSNAIKFTECGEIVIRVMREQGEDERCWLRISVADSGRGISEAQMERLFEMFTPSSTSNRTPSSGLGLAITQRLCELMDGRLEVESEVGVGTTFIAVVALRPQLERDSALVTWDGLRGVRLWLCDARSTTRLALLHHLEYWGLETRLFDSPRRLAAALLESDTQGPRLVIAGITPEALDDPQWRDVFGACRQTQRPCVALISSSDTGVQHAVIDAGAARCLPQSIGGSSLYQALLDTLAGQPADSGRKPLQDIEVLVVDNTLASRRYVALLLDSLGAGTTEAADGREAVRLWREQRPPLILMDVQMPELDGPGAAREIRAAESGSGARCGIIGMSAHLEPEERQEVIRAGMDEVLLKPFDERQLLRTLGPWVQQRRPADPPPEAADEADAPVRPAQGIAPELVELLLEELPLQIKELEDIYMRGERDAIRSAAHQIHGTAAFYKLAELRVSARRVEQALAAAGKGLPENLGDDIAEIREATNRVLRELRGE